MHHSVAELEQASAMRVAGSDLLSLALLEARNRSLGLYAAFEAAGLADAAVGPQGDSPRRWLGRLGWLQEYWIARNVQRHRGADADPSLPRLASSEALADHWYDPRRSAVESGARGPLPDSDRVRRYLFDTLDQTLDLLQQMPETDNGLYFFRNALFHEDTQAETMLGLAQRLGVLVRPTLAAGGESRSRSAMQSTLAGAGGAQINVDTTRWQLGSDVEEESGHDTLAVLARQGYRFDLETGREWVRLPAYQIDARPVSWSDYLDFVEDGGYENSRWWTQAGWHWVRQRNGRAPHQTECHRGRWYRQEFGQLTLIDPARPVESLSAYEAEAWCAWAGRRLPTEAEWECAASTAARAGFRWGEVWEWTSDRLRLYSGYRAGPLRGQLSGMLGLHRVLRGGSHATVARLRHVKYRHHLAPYQEGMFCGLRSCAV